MNKPLSLVTISIIAMLLFASSCTSPEPCKNTEKPDIKTSAQEKIKPFYKNANQFSKPWDEHGKLSEKTKQEAFDLYNEHKWAALEALFTNDTLNSGWPPGNGGFNIVGDVAIKKGEVYDRYSGDVGFTKDSLLPILGGQFTSPVLNGVHYSFGERSLNKPEDGYDFYYEIEVLKELNFNADNADVIPWYGQPGLGKQSMWKIHINPASAKGYMYTWNDLAEMGYIKVTILDSPSGTYDKYVNKVID